MVITLYHMYRKDTEIGSKSEITDQNRGWHKSTAQCSSLPCVALPAGDIH